MFRVSARSACGRRECDVSSLQQYVRTTIGCQFLLARNHRVALIRTAPEIWCARIGFRNGSFSPKGAFRAVSYLPPIATGQRTSLEVRLVPISDITVPT